VSLAYLLLIVHASTVSGEIQSMKRLLIGGLAAVARVLDLDAIEELP
jgi:hypothetical protein